MMSNQEEVGMPKMDGEDDILLSGQIQVDNQTENSTVMLKTQYPTFSTENSDSMKISAELAVTGDLVKPEVSFTAKSIEEESKQVVMQGTTAGVQVHQQIITTQQAKPEVHSVETGPVGVSSHISVTPHLVATSHHDAAPHIDSSHMAGHHRGGHSFLDRLFSHFHGLGRAIVCCHERKSHHVTSTISHHATPHVDTGKIHLVFVC